MGYEKKSVSRVIVFTVGQKIELGHKCSDGSPFQHFTIKVINNYSKTIQICQSRDGTLASVMV